MAEVSPWRPIKTAVSCGLFIVIIIIIIFIVIINFFRPVFSECTVVITSLVLFWFVIELLLLVIQGYSEIFLFLVKAILNF